MREKLIATARTFLNVPFKFRGRTPAGLDCWGLVRVTLDKFQLMQGADSDYTSMAHTRELYQKYLIDYHAKPVPVDNAKPGDLILLCDYNHRHLVHCGFRSERNGIPTLLHASVRAGKVVEITFAGVYRRIAFTAYVLPGVE